MTDPQFYKHVLHSTQGLVILDDSLRVKINSLHRGKQELSFVLAMLHQKRVIKNDRVAFRNRVKCWLMISLCLDKPDSNSRDSSKAVITATRYMTCIERTMGTPLITA